MWLTEAKRTRFEPTRPQLSTDFWLSFDANWACFLTCKIGMILF